MDNPNKDSPGTPATPPAIPDKPKEIGGRGGPDPSRYGDWEKDGKCVDF